MALSPVTEPDNNARQKIGREQKSDCNDEVNPVKSVSKGTEQAENGKKRTIERVSAPPRKAVIEILIYRIREQKQKHNEEFYFCSCWA